MGTSSEIKEGCDGQGESGSPGRSRALCRVPVPSSRDLVTEQATERGKSPDDLWPEFEPS